MIKRVRKLLIIGLASFALLLSSCNKPEYWIDGLTLPPGSIMKGRSETINMKGTAAVIPDLGRAESSLSVTFECAGGWQKVSAHFESCLLKQGFIDITPQVSPTLAGYIRTYTKKGSDYAVEIQDMYGPLDTQRKQMYGYPDHGLYSLGVMKMDR